MKKEDIKVGTKVIDRWYKEYGIGEVIDVKKTQFTIAFPEKNIIYDFLHTQFLNKVK